MVLHEFSRRATSAVKKSENNHISLTDFVDQAITLNEDLADRVVRDLRDDPSSPGEGT